jgi:thioredoxin-like negative regulator of GroEL
LQEQLHQLYAQVLKLIEEGDEDTARELIEANYEVVAEQLESGFKSIEQIAMLDILAQLRLSLGEFEEAEHLLDQVCPLILGLITWFNV